jgi:hypothetical protein
MSLNTRKTLINSKLRDMASKAPPPLIRSTKAFSVEIPEGSNSAKSRRSDVVANDDLDIKSRASHFHGADGDLEKATGVHEKTSGLLGGGFKEEHPAHSNLQNIDDPHHQDNLATLPGNDRLASTTGPTIQADAMKDRFAGGEAGHALTNRGVNEARDALHDNLQGIAQDSLKDNRQGVGQDGLHDNLQGVGQVGLHDNLQGMAQEDSFKNNRQGVGQDGLHNNLQGVGQDGLHDNLQGVGQDGLHDNLQGLPQDKLDDHHHSVGKEALHDNHAGIGNEHLEDHFVGLPPITATPSGPSGNASKTNSSEDAKLHLRDVHQQPQHSSTHPEETIKHAQALLQAKIEKEKRLEEFHGRVDAIRKTVSGINHKLDELNDEEPPKH